LFIDSSNYRLHLWYQGRARLMLIKLNPSSSFVFRNWFHLSDLNYHNLNSHLNFSHLNSHQSSFNSLGPQHQALLNLDLTQEQLMLWNSLETSWFLIFIYHPFYWVFWFFFRSPPQSRPLGRLYALLRRMVSLDYLICQILLMIRSGQGGGDENVRIDHLQLYHPQCISFKFILIYSTNIW